MQPIDIHINQLTMSSREIAELCEKQHRNVKRDIKKMLEDLNRDALTFEQTYLDASNREQTEYKLNEELTLTLVSGYNVVLRNRIIQRWQELENSQDDMDVIIRQAMAVKELRAKQREQDRRLSLVENKVILLDSATGYRTITAHCKMIDLKIPSSEARVIGKKATQLCKDRNLKMGTVSDERYGTVKSYPIEVLEELIS